MELGILPELGLLVGTGILDNLLRHWAGYFGHNWALKWAKWQPKVARKNPRNGRNYLRQCLSVLAARAGAAWLRTVLRAVALCAARCAALVWHGWRAHVQHVCGNGCMHVAQRWQHGRA